jgi:hypothetical protein
LINYSKIHHLLRSLFSAKLEKETGAGLEFEQAGTPAYH